MGIEEENEISLSDMRAHIVGEEEFVFTIARTIKKDGKDVPTGESSTITMKALSVDENTKIENILKSRSFDKKDFKLYNEEMRYLTLAYAIIGMKLIIEDDDTRDEKIVNVSDKKAVENFLRTLTHHTILVLNIKYEDAAGQILDDIKKK